ncbi:MAG: PAS domain-containing protein [Catalinimonas sp.]
MQEDIEEAPENYHAVIERTDISVCITDDQGIFVAVNDNCTRIYKCMKEELVGKPFTAVVPEGRHEELKKLRDQFTKHQTELTRNRTVKDKWGNDIEIYADAFYTNKIGGKPHKVTFVPPE